MSDFPKLKNSPIVEAILDVRVSFPKAIEESALSEIHQVFSGAYPQKQDVYVYASEQKQISPTSHEFVGYRFRSEDGTEIVQCRKDGFTFNRLKPYSGWQSVFDRASSAWENYLKAFPEGLVTRVALRYINQIFVPEGDPGHVLNEYFRVNLPGPHSVGISHSNFMQQALLHERDTDLSANWIFSYRGKSPDQTKLDFVLDIDVFASDERVKTSAVPTLWETMRGFKNRLFFESITHRGQEFFQ